MRGVEWAVEEEVVLRVRRRRRKSGVPIRSALCTPEVPSAGALSSEQSRLVTRERRVKADEGEAGRRRGDGAELGAGRIHPG